MSNGTPHNSAKKGDIAKIVIMPGDPLRAKLIAETYLENVVCYNTIRNVLGYTGTYKGTLISVQASGMGVPSMGIYSHELYNYYDVDTIIRIGSAGALDESIELGDIVVGLGIATDSNYITQYDLPGTFTPVADYNLVTKMVASLERQEAKYKVGTVLTSDIFYNETTDALLKWKQMGVLCVEMESTSLYCNAIRAGKRALSIFTISDIILEDIHMEADARRTGFSKMIEVALDMVTDISCK